MPSDLSNGDRMYRRLEVPPEASAEQIGHAYRRLAHSVHPDTHPEEPDANRRFQEITEAYEILGDPVRRARYDRNRRPRTTNTRQPRYAEANTDTTPQTTGHTSARPTVGRPTIIGLGPDRTASAPLIAGPVHIAPPSNRAGAPIDRPSAADLAEFVDALLRPWRWW